MTRKERMLQILDFVIEEMDAIMIFRSDLRAPMYQGLRRDIEEMVRQNRCTICSDSCNPEERVCDNCEEAYGEMFA